MHCNSRSFFEAGFSPVLSFCALLPPCSGHPPRPSFPRAAACPLQIFHKMVCCRDTSSPALPCCVYHYIPYKIFRTRENVNSETAEKSRNFVASSRKFVTFFNYIVKFQWNFRLRGGTCPRMHSRIFLFRPSLRKTEEPDSAWNRAEMELLSRFELLTSSLPRMRSTD